MQITIPSKDIEEELIKEYNREKGTENLKLRHANNSIHKTSPSN